MLCLALALPLGWPGTARAADEPPRFLRVSVPVKYELGEVVPIELERSGRKDLIVVEVDHSKRNVPPYLEVFRQTDGGYELVPSASETLPADLTLVGAGTFLQGAGLVLLTPAGVEVRIWRDGKFRPQPGLFLALENFFPKAGGDPQSALDWVVDLNGDGLSELVVPRLDGFHVVTQNAAGALVSKAILHTRPSNELVWLIRRIKIAYDLPAITYIDAPAGGWKSIATYNDGLLSIFHIDAKASGVDKGPDVEADLQPPVVFDPKVPWDPPLLLVLAADINNDGKLDLVFTKATSGDSDLSAKTRVLIFYGQGNGSELSFSAKPDQVFALEGFALPILLDLEHRGAMDMVLVNVEVTFWTVVKSFIARSVSADAALYRMRKGERFPQQPDDLGTFSVKFSLGRFSHRPIALYGDLNGDGLPDLLLSSDQEELGIHWGRKNAFWGAGADDVIKESFPISQGRVRVLDLDGDGRDDLLMTYIRDDFRQMPKVNHTFTVLFSRYPRPAGRTAQLDK